MRTRHLLSFVLLAAASLLAGCAGPYTISADVASYGNWPAGRQAGSYAFERLPSQQHLAQRQDELEALARPALERAGFKPAADPQSADVLVLLGAQVSVADYPYWYDPMTRRLRTHRNELSGPLRSSRPRTRRHPSDSCSCRPRASTAIASIRRRGAR